MFGSKKEKRRAVDDATEFSTVIGEEAIYEGLLRGSGHHLVSGSVIGDCNLSSMLYLAPKGRWQGNIKADVVVIAGTVEGNVTAITKLELSNAGKVSGNLEAPSIAIAEGAIYDGKIKMAKSKDVTHYKERRNAEEADEK